MSRRRPPKRPLDHHPQAVTYAREAAGLSKVDLARLLDVVVSLISEIEGGTRNATPRRIRQLARVLDCPRVMLERNSATRSRIGPALAFARARAGLAPPELALMVDVEPDVIDQIERGSLVPEPVLIDRLAAAVNCPPTIITGVPSTESVAA